MTSLCLCCCVGSDGCCFALYSRCKCKCLSRTQIIPSGDDEICTIVGDHPRVIIVAGCNGKSAQSLITWNFFGELGRQYKFSICYFDYPGFGKYINKMPSEKGCIDMLSRVHQHVLTRFPAENIYFLGYSMGCTVVAKYLHRLGFISETGSGSSSSGEIGSIMPKIVILINPVLSFNDVASFCCRGCMGLFCCSCCPDTFVFEPCDLSGTKCLLVNGIYDEICDQPSRKEIFEMITARKKKKLNLEMGHDLIFTVVMNALWGYIGPELLD